MARRKLSERNKRIVVVLGAIEAALKLLMLADLRHRSPVEVKGSKRLWGWSTVINSAGLIPVAYFLFGRRRT
ncbi:MAG: hypothetical protein QM733_10015 [Ilumatobacteraceae bacterium]